MAATLITAPELHEETDQVIRSKLLEYVPRFRQHMDRGAGDLIGDLESIIEHRLWERVGYDSMEAYANEHLQHSEEWCHEVIRIYRHDWSPEQRKKRTVSDLCASVEPGKTLSEAMMGNGNAKKEKNSCYIVTAVSEQKRGGNRAEYIIARLKRDAATDTHAAALLGSIEAGDIKPHRAAVDMGWVKTPDPARVVEKQREKMTLAEQVAMWEQWGRSLPEKAVDRVGIAVEALLNCTEPEQRQAWKQVRAMMGSAAHC